MMVMEEEKVKQQKVGKKIKKSKQPKEEESKPLEEETPASFISPNELRISPIEDEKLESVQPLLYEAECKDLKSIILNECCFAEPFNRKSTTTTISTVPEKITEQTVYDITIVW
ncbi:uncharacterized protein LOC142597682 [Dermatophagoides farinae]|uniref:uncharacterized protein LOC142597682 n=1 Tax=Dermatophagoides farinae TaxID=6954 RepID=UPI003F631293